MTQEQQSGEQEKCEHGNTTPLRQSGEYGYQEVTDWTWCRDCGALHLKAAISWLLPRDHTAALAGREDREMLRTLALETLGTLQTIAATAKANGWTVHADADNWDAAGIARRELARIDAINQGREG